MRTGAPPTDRGHLIAVDVIRFVTIGGVIAVHSTSLANSPGSMAGNAVLQMAHVTRSVFLMLSAFVLTLSADRRPTAPLPWWRRRYPLVLAPYVTWSAIYFLARGGRSPVRFGVDLLDGGARFHLYFLLLTIQLYLVFPALLWLTRRCPALLGKGVAWAVAGQLAFTGAVHYGWRPPLLAPWLDHPGSWLPSYTLYVLAGMAAARRFEDVTSWVRARPAVIAAACAGSVALALFGYVADMTWLGRTPTEASAVFQPLNVIEALTVTAAELALGLWVADRASAAGRARLARSSDVSFGVFLGHPLLVSGLLSVAGYTGLARAVGHLPSGVIEALIVFGLVPFTYAASYGAMLALRRTPLSLTLTGRRRSTAVPAPVTAPGARPAVEPLPAVESLPAVEPLPGGPQPAPA